MDKDKTDRCDFVKLIIDFTKDVLTTFPELADNLNENLRKLVISEEGSTPDEDCVDYVWNKCAKVYPPRFFDILYQNSDKSSTEICKIFGFSRRTLFTYMQKIKS